ncbi:hypothetical protein EYR41_002005 [Orbilia oligospora]|uniref:Uncharacterized protein n=1 Tax=Orbilia oligospora TaxID=2813651 RepID=A0A7C8PBN2_ORBOL|nr:hypothetical protein TWF751_011291 [Orbilia oligospora]KAF3296971.1 hypothetical protein TWF132_008344 [Orbilia oligospora]TGJ75057.1 hypothetical protein EYR41_002005 [Orbilia oligospora]
MVNPEEGKYDDWGIKTEGTIGRIEGGFYKYSNVLPLYTCLKFGLKDTFSNMYRFYSSRRDRLPKLSSLPTRETHPMSELATVWRCLEQRYDVDVNEKCSTHIHFSLLDKDWEFDDLQSLAKAILMLDPLIKRLFPDRQYKK